jgi:hypothetical protein
MGVVLAIDGHEGREDKQTGVTPARDKPKSDPIFEGWLTHHLSRLYDPVIEEPIPEDLLKLLEERFG